MSTTVTRRFEFDAGHRVLGHEGKCKHLHGHRYVAVFTISAEELDNLGRVIDFGEIKSKIGKWIEDNFDHNMILHPDDPLCGTFWADPSEGREYDIFQGKPPFDLGANPTAENIARYLFQIATGLLPSNMDVEEVVVWETPNCCATYKGCVWKTTKLPSR